MGHGEAEFRGAAVSSIPTLQAPASLAMPSSLPFFPSHNSKSRRTSLQLTTAHRYFNGQPGTRKRERAVKQSEVCARRMAVAASLHTQRPRRPTYFRISLTRVHKLTVVDSLAEPPWSRSESISSRATVSRGKASESFRRSEIPKLRAPLAAHFHTTSYAFDAFLSLTVTILPLF